MATQSPPLRYHGCNSRLGSPVHRGVVHIRDEHLRRIFDERPDPVELLRERVIAEAEAADELRAAVAYVVCIIGGAVFWLGVIAWVFA